MAIERCSIESCDGKIFAKTSEGIYCYDHWKKIKGYCDVYEVLYNFCQRCGRIIPKPYTICRTCKGK